MERTKTSHKKIFSKPCIAAPPLSVSGGRGLRPRTQKGFTLLEMLIVLALLGSLATLVLPRLRRGDNDMKKALRELSSLGRDLRNQARVKQKTYRIALKQTDKDPSFWVESAPGPVERLSDETKEQGEKKNFLSSKEEKAASNSQGFQVDTKFFKGNRKLPSPWHFGTIETEFQNKFLAPGEEKMAYIYFSPSGLVESALVEITNSTGTEKRTSWSLIFNPLTGRVDLSNKSLSLKDLEP